MKRKSVREVPFILAAPRVMAYLWRRVLDSVWTMTYTSVLRRCGRGTRIARFVRIDRPGSVILGSRCTISRGVGASSESFGSQLVVGDDVIINATVKIDYTGGLSIEDGAFISEGVVLYTHSHGLDPRSDPVAMNKSIGSGAWIGARVIVLAGCQKIGAHSVIGAGAVVTRDVPERAIMAGVPARIVGTVPKPG
ncbi:MAG: acyltransferase [Mesorhizobium sp.]|nr:MAG: acyltransferase [Mesorhizobium sp.]